MKTKIKNKILILLLSLATLLFPLISTSCNESSSISIMGAIASSRKKSDKTWRQATIVYNSSTPTTVDFAFLLANDGLHIVGNNTDQASDSFLSTANVGNNSTVKDVKIEGLVRNVFVPHGYSSSSPYVIVQTTESGVSDTDPQGDARKHYYKVELSSDSPASGTTYDPIKTVTALTYDESEYKFISKSLVNGSGLLMDRTVNKSGDNYTYRLGKFTAGTNGDSGKLLFESYKSFSDSHEFYNFWENSEKKYASGSGLSTVVLYTTSGDEDNQKEEYYWINNLNVTAGTNPTVTYLNKLQDYPVRNFIVYDYDSSASSGSFMGFTQYGYVLHSASTSDHYFTNDSTFSHSRYTPPAVFRTGSDAPAVTIFAKYSSSGFIIYSYNKALTDNKIYNSGDYQGRTTTTGFALDFRSEDISELCPVTVKIGDTTYYKILVLSTENGLTTYTFTDLVPKNMVSNGVDKDSRVQLWDNN